MEKILPARVLVSGLCCMENHLARDAVGAQCQIRIADDQSVPRTHAYTYMGHTRIRSRHWLRPRPPETLPQVPRTDLAGQIGDPWNRVRQPPGGRAGAMATFY